MASATNVLRVKVGAEWMCAIVDRSRTVAIEDQLIREVIGSDAADCPECVPQPVVDSEPESEPTPEDATPSIQAAGISLGGRRLVVILVPLDVVQSPGEAEMLVADLRPRLGGVDVVLMGQDDDGAPHYHGDADLLSLLAGVPIDRLPWKVYPLK